MSCLSAVFGYFQRTASSMRSSPPVPAHSASEPPLPAHSSEPPLPVTSSTAPSTSDSLTHTGITKQEAGQGVYSRTSASDSTLAGNHIPNRRDVADHPSTRRFQKMVDGAKDRDEVFDAATDYWNETKGLPGFEQIHSNIETLHYNIPSLSNGTEEFVKHSLYPLPKVKALYMNAYNKGIRTLPKAPTEPL